MANLNDCGRDGPGGIAAIAIFRKLGALCASVTSEPLPAGMAALVARLAAAAPRSGEQPQEPVESP